MRYAKSLESVGWTPECVEILRNRLESADAEGLGHPWRESAEDALDELVEAIYGLPPARRRSQVAPT